MSNANPRREQPSRESRPTPQSAPDTVADRRQHDRREFGSLVGLILISEDGTQTKPMVLRARDLSSGGIGLSSRKPIEPGSVGVLQIVRADGRRALMGVEIRHCRYLDDQSHEIGLQFCDMPTGVSTQDFVDEDGEIRLFDPLLADPEDA